MPERIQLSRAKGWRMPPDTVRVTRPGRWGNPFRVGIHGTATECVALFRRDLDIRLEQLGPKLRCDLAELAGKHLACWCKPGAPCHADVLLELANAPRFCIVNVNGAAWGDETFASEAEASAHLRRFWKGVRGVDLDKFSIVPVEVVGAR